MSHPEISPEGLLSASKDRKKAGEKVDLHPQMREEIHLVGGKQQLTCLEGLPRDGSEAQKQEKPVLLLLHEEC
jgi:hypothetical protein